MDHAQVVFLQLPVLDLLIHDPQPLGGLGRNDDPTGVPVDAVAQGGGERVFPVGGPLLFLVQVGLDVGEQGVHPLALVGVDHHTGALVHQQDVLVLI